MGGERDRDVEEDAALQVGLCEKNVVAGAEETDRGADDGAWSDQRIGGDPTFAIEHAERGFSLPGDED